MSEDGMLIDVNAFSPADSELARILRSRRTINDFDSKQPPRELILQAIELARWAPNHKLTEPWRFHLLGPETVRGIIEINTRLITSAKGADAARKKAERWQTIPGWLAVTSEKSDDPLREWENYAAVCCAVQNLSLFLWSMGIGVKWTTGDVTRHPDVYQLLNIDPARQQLVGVFWYGYPRQTPAMRRRSVEEITTVHP